VEFVELSDGIRLRTWTTGTPTPAPPVILLHGGPMSWFTGHADRTNAWAWALEDAATPSPINSAANRVLNAETDSWTDDDLARTAGSLGMPVWFVHGSGDPRPASAVESLALHLPNAELRIIEAAGHDPWRERPSELRTICVNFLERVG
jgi:proline iminopeptidase